VRVLSVSASISTIFLALPLILMRPSRSERRANAFLVIFLTSNGFARARIACLRKQVFILASYNPYGYAKDSIGFFSRLFRDFFDLATSQAALSWSNSSRLLWVTV